MSVSSAIRKIARKAREKQVEGWMSGKVAFPKQSPHGICGCGRCKLWYRYRHHFMYEPQTG